MAQTLQGKKIAILAADGFEQVENRPPTTCSPTRSVTRPARRWRSSLVSVTVWGFNPAKSPPRICATYFRMTTPSGLCD
jgi:hypothetical protein